MKIDTRLTVVGLLALILCMQLGASHDKEVMSPENYLYDMMCTMPKVSAPALQERTIPFSRISLDAPWTFIDKKGEEVTCEWIEGGDLEQERQVFVNAFTEIYQHFSLENLKIKNLSEFLNEAFDDEVKDLHGQETKVYALRAQVQGQTVGYAAFNETGIPDQVYIRQTAVDPSMWRRGIGTKMLFSIFKKLPTIKHMVLVTRRLNYCARGFYTSLGFKECMYTYGGYNPERYVGFEFAVKDTMCFDERTLSLREIPYSNKKINWQKANK